MVLSDESSSSSAGLSASCARSLAGRFSAGAVAPLTSSNASQRTPSSSTPVQKAWAALDVPQCGYCQSGQIMAAVALLTKKPHPTDKDIDEAMTNICRCGTYQRIRAAVHMAAGDAQPGNA